jgi:hypothetical protein
MPLVVGDVKLSLFRGQVGGHAGETPRANRCGDEGVSDSFGQRRRYSRSICSALARSSSEALAIARL